MYTFWETWKRDLKKLSVARIANDKLAIIWSLLAVSANLPPRFQKKLIFSNGILELV